MDKKRPTEAWTLNEGTVQNFNYGPTNDNHGSALPEPTKSEMVPTWNEFTQSTTIHGVKYIFDPSSHNKFRRFFWILMCLGVLIYFTIQVTTSILRYYKYQTTTDVQVIYDHLIKFPAVTICNQNNFRTTATADFGLYDYIDGYFTNPDKFNPSDYSWESVNTTNFINLTAHQIEDFLDNCKWSGQKCYPSEFVKIFTGVGVCFTFNGDPEAVRHAQEPGSRSGLSLVLNVEQYEYMRGPNNDAGVKVLLHDSGERPQLTDQGFIIAPGTHTLASIYRKEISSLTAPWGTCNEAAKPYHMCMADCRNQKVANKCGCKDVYMADVDGATMKNCNLNESFQCIRKEFALLQSQENECNCTMPCSRILFEPSLSYAQLSEFNIDQVALTDSTKNTNVRQKFKTSMERQQRVVKSIYTYDKKIMSSLIELAVDLEAAMQRMIALLDNTTKLSVEYKFPGFLQEGNSAPKQDALYVKSHTDALQEITNNVKISFWDAREVLENVNHVIGYRNGILSSVIAIQTCIEEGLTGSETKNEVCSDGPRGRGPSIPSINIDCHDQDISFCFPQELKQSVEEFFLKTNGEQNTKKLITQTFTKNQSYNDAITFTFPSQELDSVQFEDHYICSRNLKLYEGTVLPNFLTLLDQVAALKNASNLIDLNNRIETLYINLQSNLVPNLFTNDSVLDLVVKSAENVYDSEKMKCNWFLNLVSDEIEPFNSIASSFAVTIETAHTRVKSDFEEVKNQLVRLNNFYIDDLKPAIADVTSYMNHSITKLSLSKIFERQHLFRAMSNFRTINTDITSGLKDFKYDFTTFATSLLDFYEKAASKIIPLINSQNKYKYLFLGQMMMWYETLGGQQLLRNWLNGSGYNDQFGLHININTTINELNIWPFVKDAIVGYKEMDKISGLLGITNYITQNISSKVVSLMTKLDELVKNMAHYDNKLKMDNMFYMNNFLQLDIFYKELSFDRITQIKAFEYESLLGEVGGFLGLLLGASILTMCELLDYIFLNCLARFRRQKQEQRVTAKT